MPDCNQLPLSTVHIQREVEEFILMEVLKRITSYLVVSKPGPTPVSSPEIAGACEEECSTAARTLCSAGWRHCTVGNQVNLATLKLISCDRQVKNKSFEKVHKRAQ